MVRTLKHRTSLLTLRDEIMYTLSRLTAHPLAAKEAPPFEALRSEWNVVNEMELALCDERATAQACVDACDAALDDFMCRLAKAILALTKDDRTHPLYLRFFGAKSPHELRRWVLGEQLRIMKGWVRSLQESAHPFLAALGLELEGLVGAASAAATRKSVAAQRISDFRDLEERRQLFNKANITRKVACGALGALPHEQLGLPSDFAASFFRRGAREEGEEAPTVMSEKAAIVALKAALLDHEEQLRVCEAQAARDALADAAAVVVETELAEVRKDKVALEEREALLAAKLTATRPKPTKSPRSRKR